MYAVGLNAKNCKVTKQTLPKRSGNMQGKMEHEVLVTNCFSAGWISGFLSVNFSKTRRNCPVFSSTTDVCCHPVGFFQVFRRGKSGSHSFLITSRETFNPLVKIIC